MASLPTLVVVSGPAGAGKITLARQLARAVGYGCFKIVKGDVLS